MQRELLLRNPPPDGCLEAPADFGVEFLRWLAIPLLAVALLACERYGETVAQSHYQTALIGDWQGTVGDERETMSFTSNGRFSAQLLRKGFISRTLGQGEPGTIEGTWTLQGNTISLNIDSADNVTPINSTTSSEIISFKENELVVRSASGETSSFTRSI